jgi:hypothetical protein
MLHVIYFACVVLPGSLREQEIWLTNRTRIAECERRILNDFRKRLPGTAKGGLWISTSLKRVG